MRTITGSLMLAIAAPTTALVFKNGREEAILGYCLGIEASTKAEDVEKIIPVFARSGRVFYRKAEEGELHPNRCLVVPTHYEIGSKNSHYFVYETDAPGIAILDFSESPDRGVVFRDTIHGGMICVDFETTETNVFHDVVSYDLCLCALNEDLVATCPIPSWNAKAHEYAFEDNDFVPVLLPTWHDEWFDENAPTTEPLFPPFSDQTDSSLFDESSEGSFSPFEEAPFASQN